MILMLESDFFKRIFLRNNRRLWHILYWVVSLAFLTFFLGYKTIGVRLTLWFIISLAPIVILTTYFFTEFLIPRYLMKRRLFRFGLYSVYTIITSVYLELIMLVVILVFAADLDLNAANFDGLFLVSGTYIPVVVGIALKLYRTWQKSEEKNLRLLQQKTEEELKFLKSQIHPHFLFNTLNNLYALVIEKSDRAGDVVLQLSDLLSYILYDCKNDRISLRKEYEQIRNYISLEKLRYGDRVSVETEVDEAVLHEEIMPLTLLPLVENSFKHGVKPTSGRSFIHLNIEKRDRGILIDLVNSIPPGKHDEQEGGIGLENLRNRLSLYYKDRFTLSSGIKQDVFQIKLMITTHHENEMHDRRR